MQKSINPFDQSLLAEFPLMNDRDVEARLAKGDLTFKSWRSTQFSERSKLMLNAAAVLEKGKEHYARTISMEMGKALAEARNEIQKCADACRFFAEHAEAFLQAEEVRTEAKKSYIGYFPTGVILAVMPWNFPFWQVFRFAVPALMAGNVGLLKHSSNVPQCALLIEKIFHEAGFPDGAFQTLLLENRQVEKILAADCVQGVALTGSEKAGSTVASLAASHIKKSVLELGGSDPFIVLPDADIEKTVKVAIQSRMQNAGQSCIAAKRFIVFKEIKQAFADAFKAGIDAIKQGNPLEDGITMGPMARIDLAEEVEGQMKRSVKSGAMLITGGHREGANFKPALIDQVCPGMPAFDEETFGPLAGISYVESEEDAIRFANKSRYGLGASVWSADLDRAERIAREIESGTVYVNSLMRSDARLPFGGVKKSGYGRELAAAGIREFVNVKSVAVYD